MTEFFKEIKFVDNGFRYRIHIDDDEDDQCPYKITSEKVILTNSETGKFYERYLTIIEADYKHVITMKENMIPVISTPINSKESI